MITPTDRINYWETFSELHPLVAHNAPIMDGSEQVGTRKSFVYDIGDELEATELIKLHFPCVVAYLADGKVFLKNDQQRVRNANQLTFLNRFSVNSDADPSIPRSKEAAFNSAYAVMMDYLQHLLADYEVSGGCGFFKFIDENSIHWEAAELVGSNMCGWHFYFVDEEPLSFN